MKRKTPLVSRFFNDRCVCVAKKGDSKNYSIKNDSSKNKIGTPFGSLNIHPNYVYKNIIYPVLYLFYYNTSE